MQNPKEAAVIASTAIVAGSIASSQTPSLPSDSILASIATYRFPSMASWRSVRQDWRSPAYILAVIIASRPCEQLTASCRHSLRLLRSFAAEAKIEQNVDGSLKSLDRRL